jgi:hypothetical protein
MAHIILFSVAQQPNSGLDLLIVDTIGHTQPVRLLCMSDQLVAEAATCIKHNKHNRRTSMTSAGFEPAIPAIKRLQTYALDRTSSWIGCI